MTPKRLAIRVIVGQIIFSAGVATALRSLSPTLLLLDSEQTKAGTIALSLALVFATGISIVQSWSLIWARRKLLSRLTDKGKRRHQHIEIPKLNDDPWHITNTWLYSGIFSVLVAMTALRPQAIPPATALTVSIFSAIMLAAVSLPFLVFVRRAFVGLMQQVPPDIMADIIDAQVRSGRLRGRTSRRLLSAIVTPVAFLVIGSVLIVGAHLRHLDEDVHQSGARSLVTSALAPGPSENAIRPPDLPGAPLVFSALSRAKYSVQFLDQRVEETEHNTRNGIVELTFPLGQGSARVLFSKNSGWAMNWITVPVALIALLGAIWSGLALARLLSRDLKMANHGVRMLGTDAALEGTRVMRPARFRAVAELSTAIEMLSDRFRQFAQAQSRAVDARESATRSRGRFFASVSHDLKSPLNAILGFAEITRNDPAILPSQQESLDMILRRGRELLILVETILDAARVEAGQLHLEIANYSVGDLLELALNKAHDLTSESVTLTHYELPPDLPPVAIDRLRLSHALATFLAHARRTAERNSHRVLIECEKKPARPTLKKRKIMMHIEIPSSKFSARDLESMLHPEMHPGQHRGLSLALRLAKSVVELHGGQVTVTGRTVREPAFAVTLFGQPGK